MSDRSSNLDMPFILPSQAQKHVTHNAALQVLDVVTQLVVADSLTVPPASPADGAVFAVLASATESFAGRSGRLAVYQDEGWSFLTPRAGWRAWFLTERRLKVYTGATWEDAETLGAAPMLGIHTTADSTNRLAVAAAASLFSHDGQGHQMKINKAGPADTASLLFQSGWSGRAEMGLSGNDGFSLKVSADGANWVTALQSDGAGHVRMPARPLVRASLGTGVKAIADGARTGFAAPALNQGGFTLGTPLPANGAPLVVPATGIYLLALSVDAAPSSSFSVSVEANATKTLATYRNTSPPAQVDGSALGLAALSAGDELTLHHGGNASVDFSIDRTDLIVIML
ncbi:hypothetical protein BJF93_23720 [Xaviernesmea oryzae]|uniref:DUF2793 domain-containing protein n=1 Tax=Xaviernesmea oryzae TaxID=464029 RepID=A0A1Q9B2Y3_9HYPH|nr:DUF2793 domain-containing protein [Xaviernesmea oryzae]OLP62367.1 hypothetical protein BJF93_23720 [Xaviernesmea oryzae]SEL98336.1 Protein of unknown function [Xaviernesmea oryzae]